MTATVTPEAPAPAPAPDERLAYRGPIQRLLTRPEIGALIGTGAIWLFFWAVGDVFGTVAGANNYLDVSANLGIMAVAVALLMIGGEFDLSAGAMTGATGMLVVLLVKEPGEFGGAGLPLVAAIPITLLFALGVGWVNGTLVEKTALPSFIVTLGTFFVLKGAKLGFAKLFTEKVIVEGLNDAADFEFWSNIFGGEWTRNNHVWESFLGGRDVVYGVLLVAGAALVTWGLLELSFVGKERKNPAGLVMAVVGEALAFGGLFALTVTDGVAANWLWSIVMAVGIVVALVGLGMWRYQRAGRPVGSISLESTSIRDVGVGLTAIALGIVFGLVLDSSSQEVLGFLLTVQGLRAILFAGLVLVGLIFLFVAARRSREAPLTRFLILLMASASIVVVAFVVQAEAQSRKFRAEFFAVLLLTALAVLLAGLLPMLFEQRRFSMRKADFLGRFLSLTGIALMVIGVAIRMLWTTEAELAAAPGVVTYRISVAYFFIFAAIATWILLRTRFGSWTFAVGGNKEAARQVGVPAARTKTTLFMIVSVSAWLVGMLIAFRLNSVQANVGDGNEFLYIIAAVVGGNLLTGGYGSAAGAAIGALIMAMSFQGIPFSGWNSDWRWLFVGVILLLAVLVNNYVRSKAEASS